jgi:hypothetical protein
MQYRPARPNAADCFPNPESLVWASALLLTGVTATRYALRTETGPEISQRFFPPTRNPDVCVQTLGSSPRPCASFLAPAVPALRPRRRRAKAKLGCAAHVSAQPSHWATRPWRLGPKPRGVPSNARPAFTTASPVRQPALPCPAATKPSPPFGVFCVRALLLSFARPLERGEVFSRD